MQPSPEEIRSQLERVLSSPKFVSSERLTDFLRFVVEETLAGRAGKIKQYTVAVEALGYDSDFDPQADPVVRMQARRLRRALDQYYDEPGDADPVRINISKGSYVPVFSHQQASSQAPDPGPGLGTRSFRHRFLCPR